MKWADPPEHALRRNGIDLKEMRAKLISNPGKWTLLRTYTSYRSAVVTASHIRKGKREPFTPAGSFEAVYDDDFSVYVRYVGGAA